VSELAGASPFVWPVRVYWEDTDAGGIVYYANYMKFMERARTEWLRAIGIDQVRMKDEQGLIFVVVDVEAHYRKPARYGDLLRVTCRVRETTRASITLDQEVYRAAQGSANATGPASAGAAANSAGPGRAGAGDAVGGELLLDGRVRAACLDALTYRPRPLPEELRQICRSGLNPAPASQ
jgi:tol-pal system-associated acyl-CoA thioesterase